MNNKRKMSSFSAGSIGKKITDNGMGDQWRRAERVLEVRAATIRRLRATDRAKLVHALRYVGDFFAANPQHFVTGSLQSSSRVCSVGLLQPLTRQMAGITLTPPPAIPDTPSGDIQAILITLNDRFGNTPKRLRKVNHALADLLEAFDKLPTKQRTTLTLERMIHKDFSRRQAKANFKQRAGALVGAGK